MFKSLNVYKTKILLFPLMSMMTRILHNPLDERNVITTYQTFLTHEFKSEASSQGNK